MSNLNIYETVYSTDCCGTECSNDTDICPTCFEHCEVIEDQVSYDDSYAVGFQSSLDFHGAG
jgi:hypothetical protein